jgi:hypothetical protein
MRGTSGWPGSRVGPGSVPSDDCLERSNGETARIVSETGFSSQGHADAADLANFTPVVPSSISNSPDSNRLIQIRLKPREGADKSKTLRFKRETLARNTSLCPKRLPRLENKTNLSNRADRPDPAYLRAAQAYMLISMPTGTSTIFGAFQVIRVSQWMLALGLRGRKSKTNSDVTQAFTATSNVGRCPIGDDYLNNRSSARPALVFSSLLSKVPSLSGSAALKRCSTTPRYSSSVNVPSWSGSAALNSLGLNLPANSRLSRVPS